MRKPLYIVVFLAYTALIFSSCSSNKPHTSEVVLWQMNDPMMLNPINASDGAATDIDNNIFQPLLNIDYRTLKLVPVLADSLPEVKIDSAGHMLITYEIRKEARWDNGTPITAKDVAFTLKVIKNPAVNDEALRPYYDEVIDMQTYPPNPRKFTLVCNSTYILAVQSTGANTFVLPEYSYDPNKYMTSFTYKQLCKDTNLKKDPKIIAFAKEFNSEKYGRNPQFISGSGAYKLVSWATGQRVVLEKKKDWWGNSVTSTNCFFEANPSKLIYQTVNDMTTALVSLKAGNLDAINNIKPQDFAELGKSEKFTDNFNTYTPLASVYYYLGINMANPKLADVKTRQALAHLVDVPEIIKDVYYGYAKQITGHILPTDSLDYDFSIKPYEFNIDTAKSLLAEAGWKDSDGDGTLDKIMDGEKTNLSIDFMINVGSDSRKKVALMFQETARKAGIQVNIVQQSWNIFQDNLISHKFEMCMNAWSVPVGPQDLKQAFYTSSANNGGCNYINFGNAVTDVLIDSTRTELDENKRARMLKRFQRIMHEQCGYIFLCSPEQLIAVNKKLSNVYPSSVFPFYWEAGFKP